MVQRFMCACSGVRGLRTSSGTKLKLRPQFNLNCRSSMELCPTNIHLHESLSRVVSRHWIGAANSILAPVISLGTTLGHQNYC